eukprot:1284411-Rhodomonas_salina.1
MCSGDGVHCAHACAMWQCAWCGVCGAEAGEGGVRAAGNSLLSKLLQGGAVQPPGAPMRPPGPGAVTCYHVLSRVCEPLRFRHLEALVQCEGQG